MNLVVVFCLRVFLAGVLGGLVGFEREYRAKEAGVRTHFLVAIGSALMMIVSQWGFCECLHVMSANLSCEIKLDPSRVAAQVVSGIGFIGAGTIMMHKQFVRGLTTAAGLWAVAGIGLAIGGGMYILGIVCTLLTLFGLELLQLLVQKVKTRAIHVIIRVGASGNLSKIIEELLKTNIAILSCSVEKKERSQRVSLHLREHSLGDNNAHIVGIFSKFEDVEIEKVE